MDNFRIDITAVGQDALAMAIGLAMKLHRLEGADRQGKPFGITHYAVRPAFEGTRSDISGWEYGKEPKPLRLVFFRLYNSAGQDGDKIPLPFTMVTGDVTNFAQRWLEQAEYPKEADHDGSNEKGWRVYNESWGHVDDDSKAIFAVTPEWAWYGK